MDFKELTRTDNEKTGTIALSITISKETVKNELEEFYSVVAVQSNKDSGVSWNEIDQAAMQMIPPEHYREIRRDFVVNRISSEALDSLDINPALTPSIHVLEYPSAEEDFFFGMSVVERPTLTLSSYEPVEIETEDIKLTDDLIEDRISMLLETRADFERVEDRPVVFDDCISVDIATVRDGKTVPHLTGKKMIFELADGSMPDEFVRQIVGTQVGETKTISYSVKKARAITDDAVDEYTATVTVIEQLKKTTPALTDDWINATMEQVSSVAEFRSAVAEELAAEVEATNRDTHARLANIELEKRLQGNIPDAFYQASHKGLMNKLKRGLTEKGQTLENYYEQNSMNEEELSVHMFIKSGENLRQGFALEALFDGRNMKITDRDLKYACDQAFGKDSYDSSTLRQSGRFRLVENSAKRMVALNWLTDTVVLKHQ